MNQITTEPWPPLEFCLPNLDRLEEISRGEHLTQRSLFDDEPRDDSRDGRLARLTGDADATTADRMER